ncbi:hypothetical protein [Nonomuraea dietziae]|uniref:hypothetical protein n=1 Tax=Nonomuraea dietziae TaxID=65515 RepID=UPI00366FB944
MRVVTLPVNEGIPQGRNAGADALAGAREPHEGGTWICRRDEGLRLPYDAIIERTADGIPYLVPEVVLLFKAKASRPKDQADFDGVLPLLGRARRDLLGE